MGKMASRVRQHANRTTATPSGCDPGCDTITRPFHSRANYERIPTRLSEDGVVRCGTTGLFRRRHGDGDLQEPVT